MIRLFKIVAFVLVLFTLLYFLLKYLLFPLVPNDHLYGYIPEDANWVAIVDMQELVDLSLAEFIQNPNSSNPLKSDDDSDDDEVKGLDELFKKSYWHGWDIPEQFILWQNANANISFTLPLSDSEEFKDFISSNYENYGLEIISEFQYLNSDLAINILSDAILVEVLKEGQESPEFKEERNERWTELSNAIPEPELIHLYQNSEGLNGNNELLVSSENGFLSAVYKSLNLVQFMPSAIDSTALISLNLNIDWSQQENRARVLSSGSILESKLSQLGINTTEIDSLWDGTIRFDLFDLSVSQEEFISYAYNDNFEKVESKEIKDVINGVFYSQIGLESSSDSLFYKKGLVKEVDSSAVFVAFPLQKVYFSETVNHLELSSDKELMLPKAANLSATFLHADIKAIEDKWNLSRDSMTIMEFGIEEIVGQYSEAHSELIFKIRFQDQNSQGLFQFLTFLQ